jgi:alpha-beta hydrolase superfamily lysophospholipase
MEDLNPTKALEKIHCPVLVLAGDSEKVLRTEEVENLYLSIPEPKRLVFFPGAAHEDLLVYDPRRYINAVTGFLSKFSPTPSSDAQIAAEPAERKESKTPNICREAVSEIS